MVKIYGQRTNPTLRKCLLLAAEPQSGPSLRVANSRVDGRHRQKNNFWMSPSVSPSQVKAFQSRLPSHVSPNTHPSTPSIEPTPYYTEVIVCCGSTRSNPSTDYVRRAVQLEFLLWIITKCNLWLPPDFEIKPLSPFLEGVTHFNDPNSEHNLWKYNRNMYSVQPQLEDERRG